MTNISLLPVCTKIKSSQFSCVSVNFEYDKLKKSKECNENTVECILECTFFIFKCWKNWKKISKWITLFDEIFSCSLQRSKVLQYDKSL